MSTEAQGKGKHTKHGVDTDSMRRLIYRTIFSMLTFQILPKAVPLEENNNSRQHDNETLICFCMYRLWLRLQ